MARRTTRLLFLPALAAVALGILAGNLFAHRRAPVVLEPEHVVRRYIDALSEGRYQAAHEQLLPETQGSVSIAELCSRDRQLRQRYGAYRFEPGAPRAVGNARHATYTAWIRGDGRRLHWTFALEREPSSGAWRIRMD